jgi:type VI secretion system protein ImpA
MIVAEDLLKPVTDEAPCGQDLSYDASLQELELMARGKEETQFSAAELPDWKKVRARCLELFDRSKDLRIAMTLTLSSLALDGLPGFRESLRLLKGLLERYWSTVHPQLDPSDNNDPMQRMNIISAIAKPIGAFGDPLRILERLRAIPLCNSVQMGRYNLAEILRAESGAAALGDKPGATLAQIEAAFRDTKPEELEEISGLLADCIDLVREIDEKVTKSVGAANAPDLTALSDELRTMRSRIAPYVQAGKAVAEDSEPIATSPGAAGGQAALSLDGEIRSREDVVRLLNKICQYYDRTEPSSPVPFILKRAARLAGMDFMQIIEDLSPDALSGIRTITGEKEE